jgi:RimJ/RimL family protein N-acetyltransferase
VTVVVRHAEPGDAPVLVELARAVGSEPERWLISGGDWRSAPDERRYLRATRRHPDAAVFVAEEDDVIVGRLSISRDEHPASRHIADIGLMVAQGSRRRGVGRALMEAAEAWAREAGISKLELHVFPHNEPAIALYETLGYEREGFRRRQYRRGRELLDVVLMAKHLAGVVAALAVLATACGGVDDAERQAAIVAAKAAYAKAKREGVDLERGPCIAEDLLPGWVADIAHDPRRDIDDDPENQCRRYRDGLADHFVELDPKGNLIRTK